MMEGRLYSTDDYRDEGTNEGLSMVDLQLTSIGVVNSSEVGIIAIYNFLY